MSERKHRRNSAVPPEHLDRFVQRVFLCANWLHQKYEKHPNISEALFAITSIAISFLISPAIGRHSIIPLAQKLDFPMGEERRGEAAGVLAHLLIGGLSYACLRLLVPFFLIAQRALAVRELGLVGASVVPGAIQDLLDWYLRKHPECDHVRVICISGESLFGAIDTKDERPLRDWARRGKLDVVMPASVEENPTIGERALRYCDELKRDQYQSPTNLVEEVKEAKRFLRKYGNTVTEHNILCMWRVVILQNVCLVQNYFPNLDGQPSDFAPTLIYQDTGPNSYYQIFLEMFDLIKKHAGAAKEPV